MCSTSKFSPGYAIERTFRTRFVLPPRPAPKVKPRKAPRIQELLRRAEEYRRMLDQEPGLSLRKLAGRLGMTPPRLCQLLNLLKLSTAVRRRILALPEVIGRDRVTEYHLRRVAGLPSSVAQLRAYRALAGR